MIGMDLKKVWSKFIFGNSCFLISREKSWIFLKKKIQKIHTTQNWLSQNCVFHENTPTWKKYFLFLNDDPDRRIYFFFRSSPWCRQEWRKLHVVGNYQHMRWNFFLIRVPTTRNKKRCPGEQIYFYHAWCAIYVTWFFLTSFFCVATKPILWFF